MPTTAAGSEPVARPPAPKSPPPSPKGANQRPRTQATSQVRLTLHDGSSSRTVDWSVASELDWSNYSLVLGAGGATGAAFEAGVALGLATDLHVSFADARAVIGTSAGSIGAALIGLGFEGNDVAAVVAEVYDHMDPAVAAYGVQFDNTPPPLPNRLWMMRPPSLQLLASTTARLARRHWTGAALASIREGTFDLGARLQFLEGVPWPAPPTDIGICAVDARTGRREVFTRDTAATLLEAVNASCAVPGVMKPVRIGGIKYVDGGVVSPTNADLVDGRSDLVVIVSPMSGTSSRTALGRMTSGHARRRLASEVAVVKRRSKVLVIEPAGRLSNRVVDDALDGEGNRQILTDTYFGVTERTGGPDAANAG